MTTEDDFYAALDADPTGWQARLVFADWLEERGDLRAEGYRALGAARMRPKCAYPTWFNAGQFPDDRGEAVLPEDWFLLTAADTRTHEVREGFNRQPIWCDFLSRCVAEDAAALAFAKLSATRRTELLTTPRAA